MRSAGPLPCRTVGRVCRSRKSDPLSIAVIHGGLPGGAALRIAMGRMIDQDLCEPIDLPYHTIDLAVFRSTDRDVGLGPREEMAGGSQGLQKLVGDLPVH